MKIIFFGTSEFAVPSIKALIEAGHSILSVVTQPPKKKGRGLKVLAQPVEESSRRLGLKTALFEDINSAEARDFLKSQQADIFIVIAFGQILNSGILKIPRFYCISAHPSLLPKYRGAAPIQRALMNGEKETGATIIRMNESVDSGEIISQQALDIGADDNSLSLSRRLSLLCANLLVASIKDIEKGSAKFSPQDEKNASYAPKLKKEDGLIRWDKRADAINNLVRGSYPWPSAYTFFGKKMLRVLEAEPKTKSADAAFGTVLQSGKEGILVACKEGSLLIKKVQLEAKNPLTAEEFIKGNPIASGTVLGQS